VYQGTGDRPNATHAAFSPDGRKLAFILEGTGTARGVFTVNNDGTGAARLCALFTSNSLTFCNICWTTRGIFWSENSRSIYWADPATGRSRSIGSLTTNTTGNHLRMSRAGTRAYLRTDHELSPSVGGLFFEVSSDTAITNQRTFSTWDHGSVMLNDGSAALWNAFNCGSIGNPSGCAYHVYFARVDFATMQLTPLKPGDNLASQYIIDGPGFGPYTTPNNDSLILYRKEPCDGCWEDPHFFIMNVYTREVREATPSTIAPGGPITSLGELYDAGEFWMGALPNPHATSPSIGLSKTTVRLTNQTTQTPVDTVTVSNIGSGTLGAVTTTVSPAAAWLTRTVSGSGNTQYVRMQANAAGLAAGDYTTTVTVSAVGADNTPSFTVTFTVGAQVLAPSGLEAICDFGGDVDLTWTDNSDNETAFQLQRRESAGTFALLATLAANATSYRDTTPVRGRTYEYRVRAAAGTTYSSWSDTAAVFVPLPVIVVTSPGAGDSWAQGTSHAVTWTAPTIQIIQIDVSYDGGDNWEAVTATGGVSQSSEHWGNYPWTVPLSAPVGSGAQIRVAQYQNVGTAGFSGLFAIAAGTPVNPEPAVGGRAREFSVTRAAGQVLLRLPACGPDATLALYTLAGEQVAQFSGPDFAGGTVEWRGRPGSSALVAKLTSRGSSGGTVTRCVAFTLPE